MNKILLSAALLVCTLAANARVWRINYDANSQADFRTLAQVCAYKDVQDGDVFYVEPGSHDGSEADNTISRPCTVIGPGWGFKMNAGKAYEAATTHFKNGLKITSNNVTIQGVNAQNVSLTVKLTNTYNILTNIVIERNRFHGITMYTNSNLYGKNITIRNNYLSTSNGLPIIYIVGDIRYSLIEGNIIANSNSTCIGLSTSSSYIYNYNSSGNETCGIGLRIEHNTFFAGNSSGNICIGGVNSNVIVKDNILLTAKYGQTPCTIGSTYPVSYNVTSITEAMYNQAFDEGSDTYSNPLSITNTYKGSTYDNTFVNKVEGEFYDEAMRFMVQEGSIAKTAASDGGECGAFGGEHPYVLCGRPVGIPYLYDVDVPEHPTNNELKISFKVSGQNE